MKNSSLKLTLDFIVISGFDILHDSLYLMIIIYILFVYTNFFKIILDSLIIKNLLIIFMPFSVQTTHVFICVI